MPENKIENNSSQKIASGNLTISSGNPKFFFISLLIVVSVGVFAYLFGRNFEVRQRTPLEPPVAGEQNDIEQSKPEPPQDSTPWLHVEAPNGGESHTFSQPFFVEWKSRNVSTADVFLFDERWICGDMRYRLILSRVASSESNSYSVILPQRDYDCSFQRGAYLGPYDYKFLVVGYDANGNEVASDTTDGTFYLNSLIGLESPNNQEQWRDGEKHMVRWWTNPAVKKVKIFVKDQGSLKDPVNIVKDGGFADAASGRYEWKINLSKIPKVVSGYDKAPVYDMWLTGYDQFGNEIAVDRTDNGFGLFYDDPDVDDDEVRILSPNGGEDFQAGSVQNVRWVAGDDIKSVKLYVYDGRVEGSGSTNYILDYDPFLNADSGEVAWEIKAQMLPFLPSGKDPDNYKLRIDGFDKHGNLIASDKSDRTFTINR